MFDMLIFSKNRPLFLDSYLASLFAQPFKVSVLYYADKAYRKAYDQIKIRYQKDVAFYEQENKHYKALERPVLRWIKCVQSDYCILSVDDNLCVRGFSEKSVRDAIEKYQLQAFSLRLMNGIRGKTFDVNPGGIITWNPQLYTSKHSWGYSWEVSSTLYMTGTVNEVLKRCSGNYIPNNIERVGVRYVSRCIERMGCFDYAPFLNVFVDSHRNVTFPDHLTEQKALDLFWENKTLDSKAYAEARDRLQLLHIREVHVK